jgi:hypothetical protein
MLLMAKPGGLRRSVPTQFRFIWPSLKSQGSPLCSWIRWRPFSTQLPAWCFSPALYPSIWTFDRLAHSFQEYLFSTDELVRASMCEQMKKGGLDLSIQWSVFRRHCCACWVLDCQGCALCYSSQQLRCLPLGTHGSVTTLCYTTRLCHTCI